MEARLLSWWQKVKQHRVTILVVALILVVAIVLIIVGYWFDWTGFNGYNKVTIAHTISGTNAGTVIRTEEYQPGRTLWDWMQLLIIPVVLAVGGYVINLTISRGEQEATRQRAQSDREAAEKHADIEREIVFDNQQEAALQAYLDDVSQLILHENLLESEPESAVRLIARIRTLTILSRLDPIRKSTVLKFLTESSLLLMKEGGSIVDLYGADLREAYLRSLSLREDNLNGVWMDEANLQDVTLKKSNLKNAYIRAAYLNKADLREAILCYAKLNETDLSEADLTGADLEGANLSEAKLTDADLSNANLKYANMTGAIITNEQLAKAKTLQGATMPDGSTHP